MSARGPGEPLDRRLHAVRPDLADVRLRGRVEAPRFAEGHPAHIAGSAEPLLRRPDPLAPMDSQLLTGEAVAVFDEAQGWAWVQCRHDGYVGYVRSTSLAGGWPAPTHVVAARQTVVLPDARQECAPTAYLSLGAPVTAVETGGRFAVLAGGGYVFAGHLRAVADFEADWVAVARRLLGLPYLWGGRGAGGVDCSGLVQIALAACGIACRRDSDQQSASIGEAVALQPLAWQRGDLIYVKGHVVIDTGEGTVVHATGHSWSVIEEPRARCLARLAGLGLPVVAVRRPRHPQRPQRPRRPRRPSLDPAATSR